MAPESVEVFSQYCKSFSYAFPTPQYQSRRYNLYSNFSSSCADSKPIRPYLEVFLLP